LDTSKTKIFVTMLYLKKYPNKLRENICLFHNGATTNLKAF